MESSASDGSSQRKHPAECGRPDLAERLAAGEELSGSFGVEIGQHAKGCPTCSVRLSLIQQAERWLSDRGSSNRAAVRGSTPCPDAEELFDYGRGPGARRLAVASERRIEAHLVDCEECRTLIGTLATTPPAPLLDLPRASGSNGLSPLRGGEPDGAASAPAPRPRPIAPVSPAARRTGPRWIVLTAAAGLLVAGLWGLRASGLFDAHAAATRGELASADVVYPSVESLRGLEDEALISPAGRVLAGKTGGTWQPLCFAVTPQASATGYRFELRRASEVPFELGAPLARWDSESAMFDWADPMVATLPAGEYHWQAWAIVHEQPSWLGEESFSIVDAPELRAALERIRSGSGFEGATEALRLLVDGKFLSDAWRLASKQPQSAARDEFLSSIAGY